MPQIEGLIVEDMLEFARGKQAIMGNLPDERNWDIMDHKLVSDVLYTVDKVNLQRMIKAAVTSDCDSWLINDIKF